MSGPLLAVQKKKKSRHYGGLDYAFAEMSEQGSRDSGNPFVWKITIR
jgi:hypothetical protein